MPSIRKHFSLEAANFSLFSQEGEVTSFLFPVWLLRLQFTKYQQRYASMNCFYLFFFFFFLYFHLQFISGALNYTGASFCATSFYWPWAYNAPLGGALVFLYFLSSKITLLLLFMFNLDCFQPLYYRSAQGICPCVAGHGAWLAVLFSMTGFNWGFCGPWILHIWSKKEKPNDQTGSWHLLFAYAL